MSQAADIAGVRTPAPKRSMKRGGATTFAFEGKVFQAPGVYFAKDEDGVCLNIPLGRITARLSAPTIRREFGVAHGDPDYDALHAVERALAFVRQIRPGDSIPSELIDGTASWRFEPEHEQLARGRVYAGLTGWAFGEPATLPDRAGLIGFDQGPLMQARGEEALSKLARNIGAPNGDAARFRLDAIAREFAYVEALRDHFFGLYRLPGRLAAAQEKVIADRNRREEYDRMRALLAKPLQQARHRFRSIDALVGDTPSAARDIDRTVAVIRKERDTLHADTIGWRDIAALWDQDDVPVDEDQRRRATYRYLASHFPDTRDWAGG